jgi:hypothetical protein
VARARTTAALLIGTNKISSRKVLRPPFATR